MKRILVLLVAIPLCILLIAACGDNGADTADDVVHIGFLGNMTGTHSHFAESVHRGAMLYIDAYNARGGLQIDVTVRDDEQSAAVAVTMYHDLVDQGVTAIIGGVISGTTMAVVPEAFNDNMPMITASATHAGVTVNQDTGEVFTNMFRSCFIDPFQGSKMAEFASDVLGAQTAAVLYAHDIDYSIGLAYAFIERAEELGLSIVHVETFADETPDFMAQLTTLAGHDPDVLFVPAYAQHIALVGPQSVAAGLDATLLGADGWDGTLDVIADASTIEGSFHLTGFTEETTDPVVLDFIARYREAYGADVTPDMFAAQAYDAAMILIAAIELALADGYVQGTDEFKAATIAYMRATDIVGITGRITFDNYNNPQKTAVVLTFEDGVARYFGTY